ncbi:type VI secretion system-associated protein TagF [Agrobacterium sp. B1(2019)]|uniref:type VI secretion system-associated protein TagF n=1 Tax=Agrobacterium sp. B1(2019) TaxID=2607032 RepID=UPI0011ED7570|nr:type VI secretion system-associated protein TagF [Agrobacterium sp. B1(2019)]TZG32218.1 type VI secretion system-associated protein TagF [Agrobacterium sp. B1(2019)]
MPELAVMEATLNFGWYGKVPCVGDFIRSSLSPHFVGAWDVWMQTFLVTGREALDERWRDCYFSAPIWRFAFSAGMTGPRTAAGIVMPSIDRVGRQYPLCLAVELDLPVWSAYRALEPIFAPLEDAALAMLEDGASLPMLNDRLAALPPPLATALPRSGTIGSARAIVADDSADFALASLAIQEPASIFISSVAGSNRLLVTGQLPSGPEEASAFFDLHSPRWGFHA